MKSWSIFPFKIRDTQLVPPIQMSISLPESESVSAWWMNTSEPERGASFQFIRASLANYSHFKAGLWKMLMTKIMMSLRINSWDSCWIGLKCQEIWWARHFKHRFQENRRSDWTGEARWVAQPLQQAALPKVTVKWPGNYFYNIDNTFHTRFAWIPPKDRHRESGLSFVPITPLRGQCEVWN